MEKETIQNLFFKTAIEYKDNIAFNYFDPVRKKALPEEQHSGLSNGGDQTWKATTYNELLTNTRSIASYLIKMGIKTGDKIAIISENRPEWCASYLAISISGGVAVPVDAQLGPDEIRNLLSDSESKVVFHSSKTEENIRKAVEDIITSYGLRVTRINLDSPEFKDICRTPEAINYPEGSEEDVASLIYTSGTTGIPKGVELTHKNFCSDARAIIKAKIVTHNDNVLSVLPLHHTYPFMCTFLVPIFMGATITFPPSLKGPELMAAIKNKKVSILIGVPQILELIRNGIINRIRQLPGPILKIMIGILTLCGYLKQNTGINPGKLIFSSAHKALGRSFRFFGSGGAKLDPRVMEDLEALGFTVVEGYGLTETSPVVTFNLITKRKAGSAGKPLPTVEIKIMDPERHEELAAMEEGEIAIKGPMVMRGYYKNPQATEHVMKEGWFFSGDLGYMDKDGYLFITGRSKEVIVLSSGKNVYPEDVEKQYTKIPLIKEICVIPSPPLLEKRDEGGLGIIESLHAVIVPDLEYAKKAQIGNLQEALKWEINNVSLHIPQYMRVKGFTIYPDPLPRTPLGKLRRFMIKDLIHAKGKEQRAKSEDRELITDETGRRVVECIKPLLKEPFPVHVIDNLELDLGLDSLARIELVVSLEKAFSMRLPETFASEIQTVGELVTKIKEYGVRGVAEIEKIVWKDILKTEPDFNDRKKVGLHHGFLEWLIILVCLRLVKIIMKMFFRLKVKGLENLPEKGPYIITPNHASYLDGFNVVAVIPLKSFRDLYSLGFQKYFTGKFKKFFARLAHVIPVDPETYLNKALQMASYVLRNEKSLMIFPEGGRSYDGEMMEFKKGVGILSIELDIPVIPTYIKGSFEALPRGAIWPKFTEMKITFGKPFYYSELDMSKKPEGMDAYQFFVNELRERVLSLRRL
ncbi:MAG: AMP-binding protein [Nitrospirota bacterium]